MFRVFLVTDIPEHDLNPNHISHSAMNGSFPDLSMDGLIIANLMPFNIVVQFARLHDPAIISHVLLCQVSRKQVEISLADQVSNCDPELITCLCVSVLDSSTCIFSQNT